MVTGDWEVGMVRCPDLVMSALSYHPHHRHGNIARAYWSFVAGYQKENGYLHTRSSQWYLIELASRFPFQSTQIILSRNINWAVRRQQGDGGFQKEASAESACQMVLAYSRQGMLQDLLAKLRYDPIPLVESLEAPLGLKTRREALEEREDDHTLSKRLVHSIAGGQLPDGSWEGLIVSTAQAIHDLLDCGLLPEDDPVRNGCSWLLGQQKPPRTGLFPNTPSIDLPGMFYTTQIREEVDSFNDHYPEYAKTRARDKTCLTLLPIFQTGAALAALCRSGLADNPGVERGFQDLLRIRGPGGQYYTDHWCACNTKRWIHTKKPKFDEKT
jgi:hypothetical protein